MRVAGNTFQPAATKVCLTRSEVVKLAANMKAEDVDIVLGYENLDYDRPYVDYRNKDGRRRIEL